MGWADGALRIMPGWEVRAFGFEIPNPFFPGALLGVLRNADAILFCHASDRPLEELETIRDEVAAAGIELPALLAATKCDEAPPPEHPELSVVHVSVLDDASLDRLRDELWALTGLVRVHLRDGGDPVALEPPATANPNILPAGC